jgi:hypothetical protein
MPSYQFINLLHLYDDDDDDNDNNNWCILNRNEGWSLTSKLNQEL